MTGILTFTKDTDTYNQQLQLNAIQESCGPDHILYKMATDIDVDVLDRALTEARADGCTDVICLLEDGARFDVYESAIKAEYGPLFESVEVLPEQFARLREADAAPQAAVQKRIVIFPFNAPINPDSNGIEAFVKAYGDSNAFLVVNYQPADKRQVLFCKNATSICRQFLSKGFENIEKTAIYAPSIPALGAYLTKARITPSQIIFPQSLPLAQEIATTFPQVQTANTVVDLANMQLSSSIYKTLIEIAKDLADKKIKEDPQAVETYLTEAKSISKVEYIIELMVQAQDSAVNYGQTAMSASQRAEAWKTFRVQALNKLGVSADLTQFFGELNSHGLGLVTSAVNIAASAYKTHKETSKSSKRVDQRSLIVSHKSFASLWKATVDSKRMIEQEGAKKVAEVNSKKKTPGQMGPVEERATRRDARLRESMADKTVLDQRLFYLKELNKIPNRRVDAVVMYTDKAAKAVDMCAVTTDRDGQVWALYMPNASNPEASSDAASKLRSSPIKFDRQSMKGNVNIINEMMTLTKRTDAASVQRLVANKILVQVSDKDAATFMKARTHAGESQEQSRPTGALLDVIQQASAQ